MIIHSMLYKWIDQQTKYILTKHPKSFIEVNTTIEYIFFVQTNDALIYIGYPFFKIKCAYISIVHYEYYIMGKAFHYLASLL